MAERWWSRGGAAYAVYRATSRAASPLVYLFVQWRRLRGLEHPTRWRERLGEPSFPRPAPGTPLLWFHAVSLGEGLSAIPVIKRCVEQRPEIAVLLTVTTVSAFEVIKERLPCGVIFQFAPVDTYDAVNRFLGFWSPDAVFLIESELWPNLIFSSATKGIPIALLNARISLKSFKLWWKPIARSLIASMLSKFSVIAPLSTMEAIRFQLLSAPPVIINFCGDLKYAVGDFNMSEKELTTLEDLRVDISGRRVWMASSLHCGEEKVFMQIHKALAKIHPALLTIIVPRHVEHGRKIKRELNQQGISAVLRSSVEKISPGTAVYIVDTLGELRTLYRLTPIAVIGGSFLPEMKGHNLSEATAAGCAVLTGPFVGHFSNMIRQMSAVDRLSVWQVNGREELLEALKQLLGDDLALEARRAAAKKAFSAVSGDVVSRVWELISTHILAEQPR
ncbi:KDO transferase A isoform X2 [Wolffia australiana]